ncbi:MAG: hypothetical protein IPM60_03370 [Rhodospirillales bacterium]|nr:hypothetical protein [Rhodospirillales bacterium]
MRHHYPVFIFGTFLAVSCVPQQPPTTSPDAPTSYGSTGSLMQRKAQLEQRAAAASRQAQQLYARAEEIERERQQLANQPSAQTQARMLSAPSQSRTFSTDTGAVPERAQLRAAMVRPETMRTAAGQRRYEPRPSPHPRVLSPAPVITQPDTEEPPRTVFRVVGSQDPAEDDLQARLEQLEREQQALETQAAQLEQEAERLQREAALIDLRLQ